MPHPPNTNRETNPMDEKKIKNIAKRIKELIPLAKAAVYETSVEERRALRKLTDDGTINECSRLMVALSGETARGMFLEGVTSKAVTLEFFADAHKKPKR